MLRKPVLYSEKTEPGPMSSHAQVKKCNTRHSSSPDFPIVKIKGGGINDLQGLFSA